jgi:hypothetical protein
MVSEESRTVDRPNVVLPKGETNPETRRQAPARPAASRRKEGERAYDGSRYTRDEIISNMAGHISNELGRPVTPADIAGGLHLKGYWDRTATVEQAIEATEAFMDREVEPNAGS